jgi:hypothetical protein
MLVDMLSSIRQGVARDHRKPDHATDQSAGGRKDAGLVRLTFVAMALGVTYLFEFRSLRLWAINAGYEVVVFSVMGVILGAWHQCGSARLRDGICRGPRCLALRAVRSRLAAASLGRHAAVVRTLIV